MMMRATGDAGGEEREVRIASGRERTGPEPGRGRRSARMLDFSGRFDRAATPALVIAGSFILLYSLAIVWLPDAGRSAPNAILLALGVFGSVFLAVYVDLVLAERRAESRRESSWENRPEVEVGIGGWSPAVDDARPDARGGDVPHRSLRASKGGNGDDLNPEGRR